MRKKRKRKKEKKRGEKNHKKVRKKGKRKRKKRKKSVERRARQRSGAGPYGPNTRAAGTCALTSDSDQTKLKNLLNLLSICRQISSQRFVDF